MPKEKNLNLTPISALVDRDDLKYCRDCGVDVSKFLRAKMKEYVEVTKHEKSPVIKAEIIDKTKEMNDKIAREIHNFATDIRINKQLYVYDNLLDGRLKVIKNKTGYDLTKTELRKLVEDELKKGIKDVSA